MTSRRSARDYHGRLGWWVMTHDRGGISLIGCVTLAVFIADVVWLVIWRSKVGHAFGWGLLAGLLLAPAMLFVSRMIDVVAPVRDRSSARKNAAMINGTGLQFILAVFALDRWLGGTAAYGVVLSETAALAVFMTIWCVREIVHPRHPMAAHHRPEVEQ